MVPSPSPHLNLPNRAPLSPSDNVAFVRPFAPGAQLGMADISSTTEEWIAMDHGGAAAI
jgi:hypothetical protein